MKNLMEDTCASDNGSEVPAGQQCPQSGCEMGIYVRAKWAKGETGSHKDKIDPTSVSQCLQAWDVDDLKKGLVPFSMALHTRLAQDAKKLKEELGQAAEPQASGGPTPAHWARRSATRNWHPPLTRAWSPLLPECLPVSRWPILTSKHAEKEFLGMLFYRSWVDTTENHHIKQR